MSEYKTKGRKALIALCGKEGQSKLAERITAAGAPITQSAISAWVRGLSRPEPMMRRVLLSIAGIPEDDWITTDERRILKRVKASAIVEAA